jgi:hypothetical protein
MLVKVCRYKNLIGTPADKKWVGEQVVYLLSNRARLNTGRNYMKLNDAAKRTVQREKISDPVFQRIMTHPAIKQKSLRIKPTSGWLKNAVTFFPSADTLCDEHVIVSVPSAGVGCTKGLLVFESSRRRADDASTTSTSVS